MTLAAPSNAMIQTAMRAAQDDAVAAMRYVRLHAAGWGLYADRIGILGFSAGAITAINVALDTDPVTRPAIVGSIYGALTGDSVVPSSAPAAFFVSASDDSSVPPSASLTLCAAWLAAGVSAELHILESGGHGFGLRHQGKSSDQWPELFERWLAARGFSKPPPEKST